MENNLNLKK